MLPRSRRPSCRFRTMPDSVALLWKLLHLLPVDGLVWPDLDFPLTLTRLENVIGGLHPHERFHLRAESLFDPERHVSAEVGLTVQQAGQRLAGYAQHFGGGG